MQLSAAAPARLQGPVFARKKEAQTQMQFESPELKVIRFETKDILTASLNPTDDDAESDPIISGE